MAEPRSRNSRKRAAKAKTVARQPEPVADEIPAATTSPVVTRIQGDMNGWMALALAASGLAFVGFLTALLVIAASRA